MKKIIHLSDLHLGPDETNRRFETICNNLTQTQLNPSDYVIVITGDLLDKAWSAENYEIAASKIRTLEEKGFIVLVTPGNHDYGEGARQEGRMVGVFKQVFFNSRNICYPKVDIIDSIAFIGLDTMEAEVINNSSLADGRLGLRQLADLEYYLNDDEDVMACTKKVVYMHHRPFVYLAVGHLLNDRDALKSVISNKVDVLLFGHRHKTKNWSGKWGIPRVYDAGTSTGHEEKIGPHRVIDLTVDPPRGGDPDAGLATKVLSI